MSVQRALPDGSYTSYIYTSIKELRYADAIRVLKFELQVNFICFNRLMSPFLLLELSKESRRSLTSRVLLLPNCWFQIRCSIIWTADFSLSWSWRVQTALFPMSLQSWTIPRSFPCYCTNHKWRTIPKIVNLAKFDSLRNQWTVSVQIHIE